MGWHSQNGPEKGVHLDILKVLWLVVVGFFFLIHICIRFVNTATVFLSSIKQNDSNNKASEIDITETSIYHIIYMGLTMS